MKRYFLYILLIFVSAALFAQPSPELEAYVQAFPQRAAFNTHSYEFLPVKDTPAPSGFKPFYISHYGRHGSRTGGSDKTFSSLKKRLKIAAGEGILTPAGDSLFTYAKLFYELHAGMDGRLTPRGAREHEQLARRMYKRYPGVFRNGEVHALSSEVPRCLVSMAAFTSSLRSCKKDLVITWDCGEKYQKAISRASGDNIKNQASALTSETVSGVQIDTMAVFARFFTDPARGMEIFEKPRRLISGVFSLAASAEAFDVDENLFSLLPWEVVSPMYRRRSLSAYLAQCNSLPFGDERMQRASLLASEIIRKADKAIAGAPVAADLIFGHDWPFLGLCSYFGLEGYGYPRLSAEEAFLNWNGPRLCPFAANLQMVFYRNRKGDVLVKFLTNEQETLIPELESFSGPYYRWTDVKNFIATNR